MVSIIQERRRPSFGEKFSNAIGVGLQGAQDIMKQQALQKQQESQRQQTKTLGQELLGMDISDQDPEIQKALLLQGLKQRGEESLLGQQLAGQAGKKAEESGAALQGLQGALDRVQQMRKIRAEGNLGIGTSLSPFPETQRQAGEYSQLGKSLIQFATNIPIRNKLEFETLAHELYDPSITDAKAEGVLNAMEKIIMDAMGEKSIGLESRKGTEGIERKASLEDIWK